MGFLDDLGNTLSQTFSDVDNKAREMIDVASLNSQKDKVKHNITQQYRLIGIKYYEAHRDEISCEFAEEIAEIEKLQAQMDELDKKIEEIKASKANPAANRSVCENCGNRLPSDVAFCPSCGTKVE